MNTERVNYLSNFEEKVNEHGVGIQHVFGDGPDDPSFTYTVGLFEADHPEFIAFGFPPELGHQLLNDLATAVLEGDMRFVGNQRVHQLFRGAHAHLIEGSDPGADHLTVAYAIRDRRHPELADTELAVLQLVYSDPAGRWPWDPGSDYVDWPLLGAWPDAAETTDVTIERE